MNASSNPIKSRMSSFTPTPAQYEYKVMTEDFMKMNDLKKMGDAGWIFCHVFMSNEKNQYLFYRKKD